MPNGISTAKEPMPNGISSDKSYKSNISSHKFLSFAKMVSKRPKRQADAENVTFLAATETAGCCVLMSKTPSKRYV